MNFKIITANGYVIYVPFCRDSCLKKPMGKRKKQPSNKRVHKTSVKKRKKRNVNKLNRRTNPNGKFQ